MAALKIAILVSEGRHPKSNRACRAPDDARAIEIALGLTTPENIRLVYAGDPTQAFLRHYLGMGVARMTVLDMPPHTDPLLALTAYLQNHEADAILTGTRAHASEGSGFLPYAIARNLHRPLIANACNVTIGDTVGHLKVTQALSVGERRLVAIPLPAVIAVGAQSMATRQSTFAAARRGYIERETIVSTDDIDACDWREIPARPNAKKKRPPISESAADRLRAATQLAGSSSNQIVENISDDDAAAAILSYLAATGVRQGV